MTTPAYVTSIGAGTADAGGTTQSSGNVTPSGSNLIAVGLVISSDGTPVDPSGVTFGGNSCTQLGTTINVATFGKASVWYYKNPATSAQSMDATWGSNQGERLVLVGIYSGVDQTTPFGTPVQNNNTTSSSITNSSIGAVVGDLILDFAYCAMFANPGTDTITPNSSQTERVEAQTSGTAYDDGAIADLVASSTSESRSYKTATSTTQDGFGMLSVALKGATGGGGGLVVNPLTGRGGTLAQPLAA